MSKVLKPNSILIEKIAGSLAAVWFEAAAATPGMNMERHKYKNNPRIFARKNLEKFIPQAISILLDMLHNPSTPHEQKSEIYDCLIDRVNDPNNITSEDLKGLADIDIKKVLDLTKTPLDKVIDQTLKPKREKPLIVNSLKQLTRH